MRTLPVLIGVGAVLGIAGVAFAASQEDDQPPLPIPQDRVCNTKEDVGSATSELLADSTITAAGYRKAAAYLRTEVHYCDDQARQAGEASAQLLDAKAAMLEGGQPSPGPGQPPLLPFPFPNSGGGIFGPVLQIPWPGYVSAQPAIGIHNEPGTVYTYSNGDQWFVPNDHTLAPYYLPGGSQDIQTQGTSTGSCCGACMMGEECEGCG